VALRTLVALSIGGVLLAVAGLVWFVYAEVNTCWDIDLQLPQDVDTLEELHPLAAEYAARWNSNAVLLDVAVIYPDQSVDFSRATVRFFYGAAGKKLWRPHYVLGVVEFDLAGRRLLNIHTIGGPPENQARPLGERSIAFGMQHFDRVMTTALDAGGEEFVSKSEFSGHKWYVRANLFYYWFVTFSNSVDQNITVIVDSKNKTLVRTEKYDPGSEH